jgi:hypothetical protein
MIVALARKLLIVRVQQPRCEQRTCRHLAGCGEPPQDAVAKL